MKVTDVFYQLEGHPDIEHVEVGPEHTFATLRALLIEKHGLSTEVVIFLEDCEEPIDEIVLVCDHAGQAGVKAHLPRCRHVEVAVAFNGETVHHRFGPATTVARVKHWAAVKKFNMTEAEASEHVLQISGTHERPAPGTHLGALAAWPACRLSFDLVPDQRVNGAPGGRK
jgi:hypothetical protein